MGSGALGFRGSSAWPSGSASPGCPFFFFFPRPSTPKRLDSPLGFFSFFEAPSLSCPKATPASTKAPEGVRSWEDPCEASRGLPGSLSLLGDNWCGGFWKVIIFSILRPTGERVTRHPEGRPLPVSWQHQEGRSLTGAAGGKG